MLTLLFLLLCALSRRAVSMPATFNGTRCRSVADLHRIPWIDKQSTFHHLGYPLVKSLCELGDKRPENALHCGLYSSKIWPQRSSLESRSGPQTSTIIVDPPLRDDGGESSGVFVMNAIYAIFYELGYKPMVRYWSHSLNSHFPAEAASYATNLSALWDSYSEGHGENPFMSVTNYISFQAEVGVNFYHKRPPKPINESPLGRTFKWIIGYHHRNKFSMYEHNSLEMHCLGANHQLGEGLFCSSSGVIACPMFGFHQKHSLRVTPANRASLKENIVLVDSDAVHEINHHRLENDLKILGLEDVKVLVHHKRKRHEVPDLYAKTKVSLDCRNPGVEFINYEATLYDVLTLSCNSRATSNVFDFPIPSKYRLEPTNWPRLVQQVHDLLVNYESRLPDFQAFKDLSRNSHSMIANQLDVNFFSRDVLFRTYCATYSECRRTISWAVTIWILYPLARIEVFTEVPVEQYQLDNDVPLEMLARTFNEKFFRLVPWSAFKKPRHPSLQAPMSPCTHVVYMDPSLIPFGRDFLSTHMRALANSSDHDPIAYWRGSRLVLLIKRNLDRTEKVLKVPGAGKNAAWYYSKGALARPIDSFEALNVIEKSGVGRIVVGEDYMRAFTIGPDITTEEFTNALRAEELALGLYGPHSTATPSATLSADLVIDAFWIPEIPSQVAITEPLHTAHTQSPTGDGVGPADVSLEEPSKPQLWLTPTVRMSLQTVLRVFTHAQLEAVARHVDPVLRSSLLQKIIGFVSPDIVRVLEMFDAAHFPNVVSLIDAKSNSWGEKC